MLLPQVEQHIGLLVENHLDVAGVDLMVIHSIPLPIAGLWKNMEHGQAVSKKGVRFWLGTLLACRAAGTASIIRAPLPKTHRWPRGRPGSSVRADLRATCSIPQFAPHVQCSTPATLPSSHLSAP